MEEVLRRMESDPEYGEEMAQKMLIPIIGSLFKEPSDINLLIDYPFNVPFKNGSDYVSMVIDVILKWKPTLEVKNWFRVYREKLAEHFKKPSDYHDSFAALILPHLFINDLCNDDLILYTLTHELIGEEKKPSRMIFLNTIKNKVKSIIYARENLNLALELGTISSELVEVFEIIKKECQAPLDKFQDFLLGVIPSFDYSQLAGLDRNVIFEMINSTIIIKFDNIPDITQKIFPLMKGNLSLLSYRGYSLMRMVATDRFCAHLSLKDNSFNLLLEKKLFAIDKNRRETEISFLRTFKIVEEKIKQIYPHDYKYYLLHVKNMRPHDSEAYSYSAPETSQNYAANEEKSKKYIKKRADCIKLLTEFEKCMDQGCRSEAMAVLNQANFDKNSFHQVVFDKIGSSMNDKGLKYLKDIQECQKSFENEFKKFIKDEIEKKLKNNVWEKVEEFSKVVAFLYANEFFDFEIVDRIIKGSLKKAKNGSGSLLKIMILCGEKLRREQPPAYLDLLNFAYEYSQNKDKKEMCTEILENFQKTFPTDQAAGNPDPLIKLYILSLSQNDFGFKPLHFEGREFAFINFEEDAKFFAFYAPNTRNNPKGIESTFNVLNQAHVKCPQFILQLADNFFNILKQIRSFSLERALNIVHYIAMLTDQNVFSPSARHHIALVLANNYKTSKSDFTFRCMKELNKTCFIRLPEKEQKMMLQNPIVKELIRDDSTYLSYDAMLKRLQL